MKLVTDKIDTEQIVHYIPHHSEHKEDITTAKFRVVFNASTRGQTISIFE